MNTSPHATPGIDSSLHSLIRQIGAAAAMVFLLGGAAILMILLQRSTTLSRVVKGDFAPVLVVHEPGASSKTSILLEGHRHAVLFFSVDCSHCAREMQRFARLHASYGDVVEFVAVSLNDSSQTDMFVRSTHSTVHTVLDEDRSSAKAFGVDGVPALLLVNGDRVVFARAAGEQPFETTRALLDKFIAAPIDSSRMSAGRLEAPVLQNKPNTCGPAALKMILEHHGIAVSLSDLERRIHPTVQGSSLFDLKRVAEEYGLAAEGRRLTAEKLRGGSLPVILYLQKQHFVVLDSIGSDAVAFIRDPAVGMRQMPETVLTTLWNGETLIFRAVHHRPGGGNL